MEPETPVWKFTAIAVAFIVVCFFIGYYVLGPTARPSGEQVAQAEADIPQNAPSSNGPPARLRPVSPQVQVEERTEELEARRRKEEEAKRKADEEEKEQREKEREADRPTTGNDADAQTTTGTPLGDATTSDAPSSTDPGVNATGIPANPAVPEETTPAIIERPQAPGETTRPADPPRTDPPKPVPTASAGLHRVRVGPFDSRTNAQNLAIELNGRGYPTYTEPEQMNGKTVYHVQVGAYKEEKQARETQRELKTNGYEATVSSPP